MPADIRNFFGGNTSTPIRAKEPKKDEDSKKKRGRNRKVVEDSDDDEEPIPKKATPKPAGKKPVKKESPKGQETTTDDYFASSAKSKPKAIKSSKSTPNKPSPTTKVEKNSRISPRKKKTTYNDSLGDDAAFLDDDEDAGDDIFAADARTSGKQKDAYVESESDDEEPILIKPKRSAANGKSSKKNGDVEMKHTDSFVGVDDIDDIVMVDKLPLKSGSKKRKSVDLESDEEEEEPKIKSVKGKSAKQPPTKKPRASTNKATEPESSSIQAILDNIPTVRPPTPPPKDPDSKFDWRKGAPGGGNAGAPPAVGSKEIPTGEENCLAGRTFVFTGLLETLSRDDGRALVNRYGGKVTGQPSGKTDFIVLGADAGPSKLRKIRDLNLKTINEDGLFALISSLPANGGDGKAAEKNMERKKAEMDKIKKDAEDMELEERRNIAEAEKARKATVKLAASKGSIARPPPPAPAPSSQLWTSKYAPTSVNQICGNKSQVLKIQNWLKGWANAHKYEFEKKGPEGLGGYRAIMIHGPPGIGKTTAAHLAAKLSGYDILESNASDTRSKKMVESGLGEVLNNSSLLGFFAGDGKNVDVHKKKIVLIMDEVDGMSAGDRGGVGALAKICKKTDIPMILICNERKLPKMKPFDFITLDIPFKRPTVEMVRSRIATICHREGLKLPMNVIDALIEGSNKDIRQIINMISTAKLDQSSMDFEQGKSMTKAWEKSVVLKPWDICHKLLGGGMFAASSKATLNDKIELYFNDHEKSFLMVQENYLNTKPIRAAGLKGKEEKLKVLQLMDQAAESISDGDLVDRMIHGSQQQWSLMPTHGVFSTVRPASFISGMSTGGTNFTSWLGQNSKQGKLVRYVKEIQSHMRLRTSGDRHEIRQQYLPVLWTQLIDRLQREGKEAVPDVIELMDSYFLTREDFDFIMELGLGPQDMEMVKLDTQTKSTFTRLYNQQSHPMPFMKASNVMAPPVAKSKSEKPDLEEALDGEDDVEVPADPEPKAEEDILEDELKRDKFIKQPKAKKAAARKAPKKKAAKNDDDDMDDDEESEEEVKPKKKVKTKPAAKGKGKR
ncbi:putative replication factor C subunit 1 [Amylocarpus encephaloides]|uniref:Replication factor C subunit 1 n=1 Tax=Amylocarpus encephaloides TaxID=45428 RepID=A0A9P7YMD0_9HELO|nr:putative replication factor C subunit 1 [Amylocarpus encephaloides]